MIRNVCSNTAVGNEKHSLSAENENVSEYKIGHTTYTVVTKFNFKGESLDKILARLINKEISRNN